MSKTALAANAASKDAASVLSCLCQAFRRRISEEVE
jgi:hypothetical protein